MGIARNAERSVQPLTKKIHGDSYKKPRRRKGQAYLSPKVIGAMGVVPDVPAKNYIYKTAYRKFQRGDNERTEQAFSGKAHFFLGKYGEKYEQAKSARQGHCPVGESTKKYFNKGVYHSACQKNYEIFCKSGHFIRPFNGIDIVCSAPDAFNAWNLCVF